MRRPLLVFNVLLVAVAVGCAGYIANAILAPLPEPATVAVRSAVRSAGPALPPPEPLPPGGYAVVATHNLFSPTRDEAPTAAKPVVAPFPVPVPLLYGVVLREETPIAYLEDPVTKRVAGYRIGDTIGGGTLETISTDRVVLNRPQGPVDVRLHDPAKPRPTAPLPVAARDGAPSMSGMPALVPRLPAPHSPSAVGSRPTPETQVRVPQPSRRVLPRDFRKQVAPRADR